MHQNVFRDVLAVCPSASCHITHVKHAARLVNESHGLKGKLLERKTKDDATKIRDALSKISKAKFPLLIFGPRNVGKILPPELPLELPLFKDADF